MDENLTKLALDYHAYPKPGKISVTPTKPLANQDDLSLAYSPGVAAASMAIHAEGNAAAARYTSRANLVGVITNGTAVLGLGNIGPLAAKPVMEGKGGLFKKFAGIDVFDIELAENDPDKLVDIIAALEPTLGGVNLEDIKAPECFYIEKKLRERMRIPVFHDDQHGTAIISGAAVLNGLKIVGKPLDSVKLVCSGAGAAAIACLDLLVSLGIRRENIYVVDSRGVITVGRDANMEPNKARYAQQTDARTLADVTAGADVFLGCSAPGVMTADMVKTMADRPLILALANPEPEIRPDVAKAARPDCIIATGRSDYPNQVNNVLCFPFIFRGALDVGASRITEDMKLACVHAIAALAQAEQNDEVALAYAGQELSFGPDYIIPKPFDPRLIVEVASAVALAAEKSGVAARPIQDMDAYRQELQAFVYHSGQLMRPLYKQARQAPKRVIYADGEEERVLRAVQTVVDEKLAFPILVGRPAVIDMRLKKLGLRLEAGTHFEVVDPEDDVRFNETWQAYYQLKGRNGVTPAVAKAMIRKHNTLIGALLVKRGDADALICGVSSRYDNQLRYIDEVIGRKPGIKAYGALNVLMLPEQTLFITDTHVNENPNAEELADITIQAAHEMRRFGVEPKIALLSHSNFGSRPSESSNKMALARELLAQQAPDLEVDGEMHADSALSEKIRKLSFPDSTLNGRANLLVMPNLDAGNITYNLLKMTGSHGVAMGPILLGAALPAHVLTNSATVRRIVNMTALAVVDAQQHAEAAN
ncbi:NADP-dependent malic enzyme [Kerstersia gyiorum]|jgi:malate dehydrogenase (oxaloacetate-decarboxylating)(NADP+)|uniref:Malate dehydrogenase (Oxaloacetate-decarboxylating)(NADP+) n=1 Tax=Kerstersia gyiorum TaxID=206506 RepID=A0A171KSP6_9BURK|nr:NADP-dependent malic enzyme [Kerstersia gyiorum]AZV94241.1 NADP-dependent malic enzyme [Bordetella sp. J329]MCO7638471.1 NADP-dependent malic enzyme [Pseudomonas sp. S 311-6]KAB0542042.1 NADP-dependent malic enzyme [Kerstersia gyiorum]KKO71913.1 malic enzyme [Kerstersia gyiorum]MCH4270805.1 NADP-dependent malic enzyme [Kerstersia gyiorum]